MEYGQEMIDQLVVSAQVRDFEYLDCIQKEGESELIYGSEVEYESEEVFQKVLQDSSLRVFSGVSSEGERVMCMLINVEYPMKGGKTSFAMVAAIPMEYLEKVLALDDKNSLMYSYIIRRGRHFCHSDKGKFFLKISIRLFVEFNGKKRIAVCA